MGGGEIMLSIFSISNTMKSPTSGTIFNIGFILHYADISKEYTLHLVARGVLDAS